MAPSTRSKAAAATGASPTARKSARSTRQARQAPEQKAEKAKPGNAAAHPDSSPQSPQLPQSAHSNELTSADSVKKDRFPITRRFIPRPSEAESVVLPSDSDDGQPDMSMAEGDVTICKSEI